MATDATPTVRLLAMQHRLKRAKWMAGGGRRLIELSIWLLSAVGALLFVFQVSFAGALRNRAPQLALAWVPSDAEARADLAAMLSAPGSDVRAHRIARKLARESIARSPVNAVALRSLALALAQSGQSETRASALMAEAQRLSRRDVPTQMWLIQDALRRFDVAAAMQHFDVGMRSSVSSRQILFPLMANASSDPAMLKAIKERLRDKPVWRFAYLHYLVNFHPDPTVAFPLVREFLDPRIPDERAELVAFIARLSSASEFAGAWDIYNRFKLGPTMDGVLDGGFERDEGISPFAWEFTQDSDLGAYPEAGGEGGGHVLRLVAHSGRIGQVARQLIKLDSGRYRLRALAGEVPHDPFERPQFAVSCAGQTDRPPLLIMRSAAAKQEPRRLEKGFSVPSGCHFQWLTISVAGDGPPRDSLPWMDDIEVIRLDGQ